MFDSKSYRILSQKTLFILFSFEPGMGIENKHIESISCPKYQALAILSETPGEHLPT